MSQALTTIKDVEELYERLNRMLFICDQAETIYFQKKVKDTQNAIRKFCRK